MNNGHRVNAKSKRQTHLKAGGEYWIFNRLLDNFSKSKRVIVHEAVFFHEKITSFRLPGSHRVDQKRPTRSKKTMCQKVELIVGKFGSCCKVRTRKVS